MVQRVETVIVGGGQGGLSVSYYLAQEEREHLVLEQAAQPAERWRNHVWDSFTFVTPNWTIRLPGAAYQGDDLDGFMAREEIVAYFETYVERFHLPVRYGVRVSAVEPKEGGFLLRTAENSYEAANVVIATGFFQQPRIPAFSANLPAGIRQFHSSHYRNPEALPPGAVLVVGSGQSGCQIAEELYQSGRRVYLCVSSAGRVPRRYRGQDIGYWLDAIGFMDRTVDQLPSPQAKFAPSAHLSGADGGHTINLHRFARDGVVLLGRAQDAQGSTLTLAPDLKENLAKADQFEAELLQQIDELIEKRGLDVPRETVPEMRDGYKSPVLRELDLQSAGIGSVIWATGYTFDYTLVKLPVFDEDGYPLQARGVTEVPGLYFNGLHFMHNIKSGLLYGVGDDAAYVASHIMGRELSAG